MYKYDEGRYINAGQNEFYRYGKKAQEKIEKHLTPNENGFYSIPADGGKYYTIGTSEGKFGEFAMFNQKFLSVNKGGYVWAKDGTEKADIFVEMLNTLLSDMKKKNAERAQSSDEDDDE